MPRLRNFLKSFSDELSLALIGAVWFGFWLIILMTAGNSVIHSVALASALLLAVPAVVFGLWLGVFLPIVAIHEFGHWFAGRINRFELYEISVWPILYRRKPTGKFFFQWRSHYQRAGYAQMYNPTGRVDIRAWRIFVWGGPVAQILYCIFLLWCSETINIGLLALAICAGEIFVVPFVPHRSGQQRVGSDRHYLTALAKQPVEMAAHILSSQVRYLAVHDHASLDAFSLDASFLKGMDEDATVKHLSAIFLVAHSRALRQIAYKYVARNIGASQELDVQKVRLLAADCACIQFWDLETARLLMPDEEEVPEKLLAPYLLCRALMDCSDSFDLALPTLAHIDRIFDADDPAKKAWVEPRVSYIRATGPLRQRFGVIFRQFAELVSSRDFDKEAIAGMSAYSGPWQSVVYARFLCYYHYLDHNEIALAKSCVEEALELLNENRSQECYGKLDVEREAAYLFGLYDRDTTRVEALLKDHKPAQDSLPWLRASGVLAALQGDKRSAKRFLNDAERLLKAGEFWEVHTDEIDWINRARVAFLQ